MVPRKIFLCPDADVVGKPTSDSHSVALEAFQCWLNALGHVGLECEGRIGAFARRIGQANMPRRPQLLFVAQGVDMFVDETGINNRSGKKPYLGKAIDVAIGIIMALTGPTGVTGAETIELIDQRNDARFNEKVLRLRGHHPGRRVAFRGTVTRTVGGTGTRTGHRASGTGAHFPNTWLIDEMLQIFPETGKFILGVWV